MPDPIQEGYFAYEGFRNFYIDGGEGDPLLFLHPLGGSTELWADNFSALSKKFRVLALDFLGCGRSDKPDIHYSIQKFSDRLVAFLSDRGVAKATLVGNSLGGHVAMLMAINHPAHVDRLVLANPSGLHTFPKRFLSGSIFVAAKAARVLALGPPEKLTRAMLRSVFGCPPERARRLARFYDDQMKGEEGDRWRRAFVETLQSIIKTPMDEHLGEIHHPTLIIWGEKDHLLGGVGGETLARAIPGAILEKYPECGHFPGYEQPEKFNQSLESFMVRSKKQA